LNQGNKHPHSAAHQGIFIFRPQLAPAAVDPGIDPYVGQAVHLEAHSQRLFRFRPAEDSAPARRLGELTAAVTLQKLVPLLIILLAFGAFAREREDGTLRLVLGAGVPAGILGRAKAAGLMLPLLLLLVPIAIVGVLALLLGSNNAISVPLLPRLALGAAAYLLYFVIFVAVTLAVSARAGTSRQALTFLLVFWFGNCLLLPPVVIDLARRVHPAPTALDFAASLREGKMQLPVWYEQLGSIERELLQQYGKKDVTELPISAAGVAMVAEEDDYNAVQERLYRSLYTAHLGQNRFYAAAGFLAPMLALQPLSMGLAGTDFEQHADFALAAESYRREFVQMMNQDLITNELEHKKTPLPYPGVTTKFYQPGRELWETVRPFSYGFFGTGRVLQNHWLSLLYLGGWALGSLLFAAREISQLKES
jgi:ABC-2 type transport system permease protein